jgi:uncharacterized SAM-binding protein YcdF (DUF218 family)
MNHVARTYRWRWWLTSGAACALATLLWWSHATIFTLLGRYLDIGQPPVKTDYVLVLNGDVNTRPFVAAALVTRGWAQQVLITKVKLAPQWQESPWPPEHEVVRRIQLARGVSEDRLVVLESSCDATRDEALVLRSFLAKHPTATVTIVTGDFHTRRTRWIFRQVCHEAADRLHFVSAPTDFYHAGNWWRFEESFVLYLQEYGKFLWYQLAYGWLGPQCAALGLLLGCLAWWIRKRGLGLPLARGHHEREHGRVMSAQGARSVAL